MVSKYFCARPHLPSVARRPRVAAFTMVELVLSLAIMSVLMLGLASALIVASHALPDRTSAAGQSLDYAIVAQQIAEELSCAAWFIEHTATTVEFTIADRDDNLVPERIRYEWSGVPGAPLLRYYNGSGPVQVLAGVGAFALSYETRSVAEQYKGALVEGAQQVLFDNTGGLLPASYSVTSNNFIGQYAVPALPNGAVGWKPTRATLMARYSGTPAGESRIQIRGVDANNHPTSTIYTQTALNESSLTASYTWTNIDFTEMPVIPAGVGIALTAIYSAGTGTVLDAQHYTSLGSGRLTSTNGGSTWSLGLLTSMRCSISGKPCTLNADQSAARGYITAVSFTLTPVEAAPAYSASAALNVPELLSGKWEADFSAPPTTDLNGDGTADWTAAAALGAGEFSGDAWGMSQELCSQPNCNFDRLTTIDVAFRSTAVGVAAKCCLNADRANTVAAWLALSLVRETDGSQTLTLSHMLDTVNEGTLTKIKGLGAGLINARLLIDPALDTVNLRVEGQEQGTFFYNRVSNFDARRSVVLPASAGGEIDYIRVRVSE